MIATHDPAYGADADGHKGEPAWDAGLDNSPEERQEIAEQICKKLLNGDLIDTESIDVTLTHIERTDCTKGHDGKLYCMEHGVEFGFEVPPIEYMDLVIPMALAQVNADKSPIRLLCLLYLEQDLIKAGYNSKEMDLLTGVMDLYREAFKEEEK